MQLRGCLPARVSCNYVPLRGNVLEIGERKRKRVRGGVRGSERESEQIEKMQVKMSDVLLDCNPLYYTITLHCCQL